MVEHIYYPSTSEVEAGVQGQPELRESLPQKEKKNLFKKLKECIHIYEIFKSGKWVVA